MVGWPYNTSIDETKLDADADSTKGSRPVLKNAVDSVKSMQGTDTSPTMSDLGTISASGTATLNIDTHNAFKFTVGGNMTLALSGTVPSTQIVQGIIQITNGGSATITYSSYFKFVDGVAPTLTSSGIDILSFISFGDSTKVHLFHIGRAMA